MRITTITAVLAILASSISLANAQGKLPIEDGLRGEVGLSQRLHIPGEIANLTVGAPDIADVLPLTSNIYVLNAKRVGTTNIMAIDENGNEIYHARLFVRPVDIWPSFAVRVTPGAGKARRYICSPGDRCTSTDAVNTCMHPDDVAADGSRCGDRAASVKPGGVDGEGAPDPQPES
jgi:Flp pilus assembly secretin CpaC